MRLVQILGTTCPKCNQCERLKHNAEEAVRLSGVEARVEQITDIVQITSFGVMITPALAVDGKVKVVGRVLSPEEIREFLE